MTIGIAAVAGAALVGALSLAIGLIATTDDDDRPPIIVNNGSVIFDNGDPDDPFQHWLAWKADADGSGRWRSDQPNGRTANSFFVAIRNVKAQSAECGAPLRGSEVWIDFTPDAQKPVRFHFWRDHIYDPPFTLKYEPVLEPPSGITSAAPPASGASPIGPPTLTFGGSGAITLVKVDATECAIPQSDQDKKNLRIYVKPSPSKVK